MFHRQNFSADNDCVGNWCLHYELLVELQLTVWVKFIRHINEPQGGPHRSLTPGGLRTHTSRKYCPCVLPRLPRAASSSVIKMGTADPAEPLANSCQTTQRHMPSIQTVRSHRCKNLHFLAVTSTSLSNALICAPTNLMLLTTYLDNANL